MGMLWQKIHFTFLLGKNSILGGKTKFFKIEVHIVSFFSITYT